MAELAAAAVTVAITRRMRARVRAPVAPVRAVNLTSASHSSDTAASIMLCGARARGGCTRAAAAAPGLITSRPSCSEKNSNNKQQQRTHADFINHCAPRTSIPARTRTRTHTEPEKDQGDASLRDGSG